MSQTFINEMVSPGKFYVNLWNYFETYSVIYVACNVFS